MAKSKSSFETAFRIWVQEEREKMAAPVPDEDEFLLYRDQRLTPERQEEIRRQLVLDPGLAASYLELPCLVEDAEREKAWQEIIERLGPGELESRPAARPTRDAEHIPVDDTPRPKPWQGWLAAGWLLTAIGLGSWVYVLKNRAGEGSTQLASVTLLAPGPRVAELLPQHVISRSELDLPTLAISPEDDRTLLFLAMDQAYDFETFRAELRSPSGTILETSAGLVPTETGQVVVSLSARSLLAGVYEITVQADLEEVEESPLVGIYPFRLERPETE